PDPQRQGRDRHGGEAGAPPQRADRELYVLEKGLHAGTSAEKGKRTVQRQWSSKPCSSSSDASCEARGRTTSSSTWASTRWIDRSPYSAYRGAGVTVTTVAPPACSSSSRSITATPFVESGLPVASSASRTRGLPPMARATATLCCG